MTNQNQEAKANGDHKHSHGHLTRRGKAALALGGAVAGYLLHPVVTDAVHGAENNVHQANESGTYSQYHLYEKMHENNGFDASKVLLYHVGPGDNPSSIATFVGAKDERLVAGEIAGQEGGELSVQPGDYVVIPKDQLAMPDNHNK